MSAFLSTSGAACGPGAQVTSGELLEFQSGIVERGLKREALSEAQRAEISKLWADVEALQKAGKRSEARDVMKKIVAMFSHKDMMGAVEPIVPGCAPRRAPLVTGTLQSIETEPNVVGARCGYHYILTVKESGANGKTVKLTLYDLANAPYDSLKGLLNKPIEAETMGSSVVSIGLAESTSGKVAALKGLSPLKPC